MELVGMKASGGMMAKGGKVGMANRGIIKKVRKSPKRKISIAKGYNKAKYGEWKYVLLDKNGVIKYEKWSKEKEVLQKELDFIKSVNLDLYEKLIIVETDIVDEFSRDPIIAKGGMMAGGRVTFDDKVKAISMRLEGTDVPRRLRKDYGKRYNREEAKLAAKRIAGAMRAKER